jgi:hypothetical protein
MFIYGTSTQSIWCYTKFWRNCEIACFRSLKHSADHVKLVFPDGYLNEQSFLALPVAIAAEAAHKEDEGSLARCDQKPIERMCTVMAM